VSGCSSIESNAGKLFVKEIKVNTHPTNNNPICEGGTGTVSFTVDASGPDLTYQWQADSGTGFTNIANGGVYSNVTTATMSVTGAPFNMHGRKYRCVVSGSCTSVNSNFGVLLLKVKPGKPVINVNLNTPETPVLTAAPGDQFTWYKNGTQISVNPTVNVNAEGSYTVLNKQDGCEGTLSDPRVVVITGAIVMKENGIRLYPNPVAETLVISLSDFKSGAEVDITLLDLLGRTVDKTSAAGGGEKEVSVSRFQPGRYAVILQQGSQRVVSHFIKSNH
jgi:hypothetical protein